MGKESLTKSTTKKKAATKKKKTEAKKGVAATKAAAPKAPAKPSLKELLARKYATAPDQPLYSPPAPKRKIRPVAASPFYEARDEKEAQRMKALLAQKFSIEDIRAAAEAKAKAEEEARIKAEAEAKAKAEEETRIKAEAEAKAKAEEETRIKAEAEAKAKAEEETRIKAEAEAKAKAEEETRIKAEAEAKAKAEEETRIKAEAEAKAKAEEETRIKAEAEAKAKAEEETRKIAAERAAAREAAAQKEPQVSVTYDKIESDKIESPPAQAPLKRERLLVIGLAGGVALIFLLIIGASLSNSSKYYLTQSAQGLEIWQGKFAPLGKCKILTLPGVQGPETLQPTYRKADVMGYAVAYYLAQADTLLARPGLPDFESIKARLNTALGYATSREERERIQLRLDGIEKAILLYRAQVAAAQQTLEGLDQAIDHLRQALHLTSDPIDIKAIEAQIAAVEKNYADIEARLAEEAAQELAPPEAKPAS